MFTSFLCLFSSVPSLEKLSPWWAGTTVGLLNLGDRQEGKKQNKRFLDRRLVVVGSHMVLDGVLQDMRVSLKYRGQNM